MAVPGVGSLFAGPRRWFEGTKQWIGETRVARFVKSCIGGSNSEDRPEEASLEGGRIGRLPILEEYTQAGVEARREEIEARRGELNRERSFALMEMVNVPPSPRVTGFATPSSSTGSLDALDLAGPSQLCGGFATPSSSTGSLDDALDQEDLYQSYGGFATPLSSLSASNNSNSGRFRVMSETEYAQLVSSQSSLHTSPVAADSQYDYYPYLPSAPPLPQSRDASQSSEECSQVPVRRVLLEEVEEEEEVEQEEEVEEEVRQQPEQSNGLIGRLKRGAWNATCFFGRALAAGLECIAPSRDGNRDVADLSDAVREEQEEGSEVQNNDRGHQEEALGDIHNNVGMGRSAKIKQVLYVVGIAACIAAIAAIVLFAPMGIPAFIGLGVLAVSTIALTLLAMKHWRNHHPPRMDEQRV